MASLLEKNKIGHHNESNKSTERIPRFTKDGHVKRRWLLIPKTIGILLILIGAFIASIHIPVLLYNKNTQPNKETNAFVIMPDELGIHNALQYELDNPNEDFDSDGLPNIEEANHSTNTRNPDSDNDGISDYAEIYIYNTHPLTKENTIYQVVNDLLTSNNTTATAPYKLHEVILWADDLRSRSTGTLVPTLKGYRFINFNGWVKFPNQVYAYILDEQNNHVILDYREEEDAWRIETKGKYEEILLYNKKLDTVNVLTIGGKQYAVSNGLIKDILSVLLPKAHSFITFNEMAVQDLLGKESVIGATITGKFMPEYDKEDMSRFGENTIELTSLTSVYSSILSGKPVALSLQSRSYGEVICLAYGYTEFGDLLICDTEGNDKDKNGNPMMLDIIEYASITVDQNNQLRQREYFLFKGLGFDGTSGDRIHFINLN